MNRKRLLAATALAATVVGLPAAALANVGGFDDVPDDHTHAEGIGWLVDNGITSGCDADSYCPSDFVSRAQMATFMMNLADGIETPDAPATAFETFTDDLPINDLAFQNASADCDPDMAAVSGGYLIRQSEEGAVSNDWYAAVDAPTDAGDGWTVSLRTLDDAPHDAFVTVYVTCVAS